jgi:hypothetical protein
MKSIVKYTIKLVLALVVATAFPLKACAQQLERVGNITMTTESAEISFKVEGSNDISINWGDGQVSRLSDVSTNTNNTGGRDVTFTHTYSRETARNIVITGNVTKLDCSNSNLIALDVSNNPTLEELTIRDNRLTVLNVSRNTALKWLDCRNNQLDGVDLSRNIALEALAIDNNKLTSLDVSRNTALRVLELNHNQLTRLDLSNNNALRELSIVRNQFTAPALDDLFRSLPDLTGLDRYGYLYIVTRWPEFDSSAVHECDRSIAINKGWNFRTWR